jgi:hypothetical protein
MQRIVAVWIIAPCPYSQMYLSTPTCTGFKAGSEFDYVGSYTGSEPLNIYRRYANVPQPPS